MDHIIPTQIAYPIGLAVAKHTNMPPANAVKQIASQVFLLDAARSAHVFNLDLAVRTHISCDGNPSTGPSIGVTTGLSSITPPTGGTAVGTRPSLSRIDTPFPAAYSSEFIPFEPTHLRWTG